MRNSLIAAALALATLPAMGQTQANMSITVGQPGFYGQINIGNMPPPPVVRVEPIIVQRPAVVVAGPVQPVYLRVPPGHQKHWAKHCHKYNACGQHVLFVKDDWYVNAYAPAYRKEHGEGDHDDHGDNGKHKGKGHGKHKD